MPRVRNGTVGAQINLLVLSLPGCLNMPSGDNSLQRAPKGWGNIGDLLAGSILGVGQRGCRVDQAHQSVRARTCRDQMIGRLLDTKAVAEANPEKVKDWIKAGETFRLDHNPKDRLGFFSAVAVNVSPDEEVLIAEVAELGFKHNDKFECYEGTIDIASALDALRGTDVTLRVKVGRAKNGRYIVAL